MAKTKTIPLSSVAVGMYLCGIDRSWIDTPFLRHKFVIRSSADIEKLHQCGVREVTIDITRGLDVITAPDSMPESTIKEPPPAQPQSIPLPTTVSPEVERIQNISPAIQGTSLAGELTSIQHTREYMLDSVQDILETLAKTGGMSIEQVNHVTHAILSETLDHEEAYIALIRTREFSPALYDHALAVSTLGVLLGRAVGLDDEELQHLAYAGLFHDSGLLKIPEALHRPILELSESEFGIYQSHPKRGIDFVTQQTPLPDEVQTLIREHHVALDGSGYPSGIEPSTIRPASRILRIVDEYDELLSGHQSGTPQTVRVALQGLYQQGKKGSLDGGLVAEFINLIGIYPTYSLVELSTGERGIVTANSKDNLLHPTILLIQDAKHQSLPEPIPFNFSVLESGSTNPEIISVLPPEKVGIQLESALDSWVTL